MSKSLRSRSLLPLVLSFGLALSVLTACGGDDSATTADGLTKIKIGVAAPTAEQSLPAVAQELGLFKKYGIEAEVSLIGGGPEITAGLIGGSLDFGVYSAPGPEVGIIQGAKMKYVGVWSHRANLGLVVAPGIDSVEDLEGEPVAVSAPGTTTAIYTDMALEDAGLDPATGVVRRNVGSQGAALSAFASGQVKAAIFGAPVTYAALAQVKGSKVLVDYSTEDVPWPYGGIVASTSTIDNDADTVTDVIKALREAAQAYQDPAQAEKIKGIISKFTQISGDPVTQSFDVAAQQIDPTLVPRKEDHEEVLSSLAITTPAAKDFDVNSVVDFTFTKGAGQ